MTSGTVTITALSSVQIKIRKKEGNQHLDTLAYRNVSEALDWQVNFLLLRYLALCYFSIERRTAGGFRFLSLVQGLQMRPRSNFFCVLQATQHVVFSESRGGQRLRGSSARFSCNLPFDRSPPPCGSESLRSLCSRSN